jgi:surface protein
MKLAIEGIILLIAIHTANAIRCRRWLGKCVQNSDCCNNRRCMKWGRCSLFHQVQSSTVDRCFENSSQLINAIRSYKEGTETQKNRVKGIHGDPIGTWCVDYVQDFKAVFDADNYQAGFNEDISNWNTSSATKMFGMFFKQTSFNKDLSRWDVSKVTDMSFMFGLASSFNTDISSWDVSRVSIFYKMFNEAIAFNQDISSWDVSTASAFDGMFSDAISFNKNLCHWSNKFSSSDVVINMFKNTNCPNKNDPVFAGNMMNNMCHSCV